MSSGFLYILSPPHSFRLVLFRWSFSIIHNYTTIQSIRLSLPKVKLNYGRGTFILSSAQIFNELPLNNANAESVQTFCRRASHFFLS